MKVKNFNERLIEALKIRDIRPVDLATKINASRAIVSQYMSGKFTPNHEKISELAEALNVNEVWLMGYEVPMDEEIEIIDEKGFLEMLDIWLVDDAVPIEIKRQAYEKIKDYLDKEKRK